MRAPSSPKSEQTALSLVFWNSSRMVAKTDRLTADGVRRLENRLRWRGLGNRVIALVKRNGPSAGQMH